MDNLWPIALGIIAAAIILGMLNHYAKEQEREDTRKANALDFAQAKIPNAAPSHVTKLASAYLAWFETGKSLEDQPDEADAPTDDLEIPYIGGRGNG